MLGGLYLSFYRFFCSSLPTFFVGLFRFSFVKFNIIQGRVFVNTFCEIFLFIFIIFVMYIYFCNFRYFSTYYLSFKKTPMHFHAQELLRHLLSLCRTSSRSGIALAAPSRETAMLAAILAIFSALTGSCSFRYSAIKYPV